MRYGSVCSGIEAATAAWHHTGWEPSFFSEIEAFPRAVLQHHYPEVPLHGDFTTIGESDYEPIDLLVGGTPCQSFSVAGLRKGLDDDRGNLSLEFIKLAQRLRPKWVVWENVPGVLSSGGGRDFGSFLGALGEIGYGFAYRVLDAQYFGVAQRRRRVFVVGCLGDWRSAAAVLFERESLSGNPAPSREARDETASEPEFRTYSGSRESGVAATLETTCNDYSRADGFTMAVSIAQNQRGEVRTSETVGALSSGGGKPGQGYPAVLVPGDGCLTPWDSQQKRIYSADAEVSPTLCAGGGYPPAVALTQYGNEIAGTLTARHDSSPCADRGQNAVAFHPTQTPISSEQISHSISANSNATSAVVRDMAVRRLTPRECERLQGFPDDFTQIPYRNKPADKCPDGPRYKALGNSMAVPVMAWIGERIQRVNDL